jgi:drug/metabolite transporter (DMT)-like permease
MDPYHIKKIVLFFLVVCASTAGELCISRAMKSIGEVKDFRPMALLRTIWSAMQVGVLWAGLALMAVAFFSMLMLLSMENVSFVVPATALSYAAGAYGSRVFLGERVAHLRWAGVVLVCIGVALVWQGKG